MYSAQNEVLLFHSVLLVPLYTPLYYCYLTDIKVNRYIDMHACQKKKKGVVSMNWQRFT